MFRGRSWKCQMIKRPLVAVDLDGTVVEPRYPDLGDFKPGAVTYLKKIMKTCQVVIYTARLNNADIHGNTRRKLERGREYDKVRRMLDNAGLQDIDIWLGADAKPASICFVDDRAIEFRDNWRQVYRKVMHAVEKARSFPEYVTNPVPDLPPE